ncbi:Uncharacterised protein [Legionella pneumophila]|uniref:hypothetical protein n=1 Tax=Legionella pneumophila TaxID=446 RepID=UPI000770802D|nr:hypothetical protein [Legionella pneumophila]CZG40268.1 Uncharacterised protein [Legionella pneumophila]CZH41115.1 Uncharacterised protein [Legionella pneumophila]
MSAESRSKNENRRDERSKALESNPCGMCRAAGLPICKGHGGGGGGGGGGSGDEAKEENSPTGPTPKNVPSNVEIKTLSSYLENSEVWNSDEDFLYDFNNDSAVFSIELDSARGLIHFQGNEFLSANDVKDLNELYDRIEDELKMFTDEVNAQNISFSREGNNLKINIPDPNLYDQFVTRLLNKNLMPDNNHNADLNYKSNSAAEQKIDVNESVDSTYKSPNPFDISKGPTPSDDG